MQDGEAGRIPRWEYRLLWRYPPLLLIVVGLGLMAAGLAGVSSTAISTTALGLGFVSILSGAVLPRIDGKFKASVREVSGQLMAPHELDYAVSGSAVAPVTVPDEPGADDRTDRLRPEPPALPANRAELLWMNRADPDPVSRMSLSRFVLAGDGVVRAPGDGDGQDGGQDPAGEAPPAVVLGDVWDTLKTRLEDDGGFHALASTFAKTYLRAPDGRLFALPKPGLEAWRPASPDLLQLLESWGATPVASGKYPRPRHAFAHQIPVAAELDPPDLHLNGQQTGEPR
jgi:hypothetical protein